MVKALKKNIITIIPARGGSKRIHQKNIVSVGGLPMLAHSILQSRSAKHVKATYVSTEDMGIASVAKEYGAQVIKRPRSLASDTATSESVLLHALNHLKKQAKLDPDAVVFLQPTSPFRAPNDIDLAVEKFLKDKSDSLVSICPDHGLFWRRHGQKIESFNYDYTTRKREQDWGGQFRENGSIYIFKPEILRRQSNRLGGKISWYEMDKIYSFQIDEPGDIPFMNALYGLRKDNATSHFPAKLSLVVFDFDGVFTDNTVKSDQHGNEHVITSRRDSLGISFLRRTGIPAMVLSTEQHPVVAARCKKLQLPCHQGVDNKKEYLKWYLKKQKIDPAAVAYVGNDTNDLKCFDLVGLAVAVADSDPKILTAADYILSTKGGGGAVREICELIIQRYGKLKRDKRKNKK